MPVPQERRQHRQAPLDILVGPIPQHQCADGKSVPRPGKCRMTSSEPLFFSGLLVVGSALSDVFSSAFEARRRHEYEHDIQISEGDPSAA
jgi:hypothetical protein